MQAQPPDGQEREGLRVVRGEIGEIQLHPRIGQRHLFPVRADDPAALGQAAECERAAVAGLPLTVIPDDVEKRLEAGLHAGVGGVGVDFENQIGLRSQLGREQGVRERIDRAAEIADAKQEQIGMLPGEGHAAHDLVGEMPGGRTVADGQEAIGGNHRDPHAGEFPAH